MICRDTITIDNKLGRGKIHVPCGTCYECRMNYRNQWTYRLQQELKDHINAHFITLTFDEKHKQYELSKTVMSQFIKRLRTYSGNKLRYFGVGEIGEISKRIHYHFIIFGLPDIVMKKNILKAWTNGIVHIGNVTEASMHYLTKDMFKFNQKNNKYERKNVRIMSTKPVIGTRFLRKVAHINKKNDDPFVTTGKAKIIMPRIFKEKIYSYSQKDKIRKALIEYADKKSNKVLENLDIKMGEKLWNYINEEKEELLRLENKQLKKRKL